MSLADLSRAADQAASSLNGIKPATPDRALADAIRRGQMPETLTALSERLK